jgi:hypothetical protein
MTRSVGTTTATTFVADSISGACCENVCLHMSHRLALGVRSMSLSCCCHIASYRCHAHVNRTIAPCANPCPTSTSQPAKPGARVLPVGFLIVAPEKPGATPTRSSLYTLNLRQNGAVSSVHYH